LLLSFLTGCVSLPIEETECSLLTSPPLVNTVRDGIDRQILTSDLPTCRWWDIFEDETLSYLIDKALLKNPTLQEAMARVDQAKNEAVVARSALFPTVGFYAELNNQHLPKHGFFRAYAPTIPPNVTEYSLGLDFSYEFDFWGKRKNLYRAALGEMHARAAEMAQADLMISTALAGAYFNYQIDRWQDSLVQRQEEVLASLYALRLRRKMHALDNANDVLAVEKVLSAVQQQKVLAEQLVVLDRHLILSLMGEGPEDELNLDQIPFESEIRIPVPPFLECDLLAYRPDLMAQIWRVEAAAHAVGAAKADFYPNINLSALGGVDSVFIEKLFTEGALISSVLPALHLPIFTAGRIKANLREQQAVLEEEIMAYNHLLLEAAKEVADGVVQLKASEQNLHLQEQIVFNRQESEHLASSLFQHALYNSLDVLDARLDLLQQEWLQAEAQRQHYLAAVRLMRALGGGYQASCEPLTPKGGTHG
jgi:NodT family efflux transporter outer membrane factor (OMF) lipoprotein